MNLPVESARLAAWAGACLDGDVAPDALSEHAVAPGHVHRVAGLPAVATAATASVPGDSAVSLPLAVAELRRRGARRAWLVWPAPGDPAGLPGPAELNRLALEAGEAVVVEPGADGAAGLALVPSRLGPTAVLWTALPVLDPARSATSLAEADRALKAAIREATDALDALDVARARPEDAPALAAARLRPPPLELPPGYDPRARSVLDTAQRLDALLGIAQADDGAAVTRRESDDRAAVLRELRRAVRHAFVAAVNAPAEESVRSA